MRLAPCSGKGRVIGVASSQTLRRNTVIWCTSTLRPLPKAAASTVQPQEAGAATPRQAQQTFLRSTPAAQHRQHRQADSPLIVVEGWNDKRAVLEAVDAEVFVLGGALHAKDAQLVVKLRKAAHRHSGMIALLDPDPAGRQGRQALHEKFGPACLHAFVPGVFAHATTITRWHDIGNIGVEHCSADAIRHALRCARPSRPERKEFTRDDLQRWKLYTPMNAPHAVDNNAPRRRAIVGMLLGIGYCDAKQMLAMLNVFDFRRKQVDHVVHLSENMLNNTLGDIALLPLQ